LPNALHNNSTTDRIQNNNSINIHRTHLFTVNRSTDTNKIKYNYNQAAVLFEM